LQKNTLDNTIYKMSLYTSDVVGDMLAEGSYSMFHLQSDEVKVMERMSTRNARRKISLPSPLPGIREIQDTEVTGKLVQCQSNIPIRKKSVLVNGLQKIDENFEQSKKDSVKSYNPSLTAGLDKCKDMKQKAQRRFSLTENYQVFPNLDPNKKCLGQSNINQDDLDEIPKEKYRSKSEEEKLEENGDFDDEILLLPSYVLSLDGDTVENSLHPLLSLDKPPVSGDRQWEVRQASEQERTVWIFKGWNIRNI